jgi:hypothetical protein
MTIQINYLEFQFNGNYFSYKFKVEPIEHFKGLFSITSDNNIILFEDNYIHRIPRETHFAEFALKAYKIYLFRTQLKELLK